MTLPRTNVCAGQPTRLECYFGFLDSSAQHAFEIANVGSKCAICISNRPHGLYGVSELVNNTEHLEWRGQVAVSADSLIELYS